MAIYKKLMGNPFVDAGVSGICEWLERQPQPEEIIIEDLEVMINRFATIYCNPAWIKNLHSVFPGAEMTNPANKNKDIVALLRSNWQQSLDKIIPFGQVGDCTGCGRRPAVRDLIKKDIPLTGSGRLRNFFPLFSDGQGYCAACALAVQFVPLSLVSSGGKFLMLHADAWRIQKKWTQICVSDIQSNAARNEFTGCFNPGYTNPRNGLFYMTRQLIDYEERRATEDVVMQIFYFSNYNQGPELEIFHLPASVFRFLRYAYQNEFRQAWQQIVRSGYQWVKWDKVESEEDYKNKTNLVYEFLLQGRSIVRFFINRRARKARSDWELLFLYLREVRNMDESRLNAIKQVGDFIAESIRKSERDRRLRQLESAGSYSECRNILRFVIRDRIQQGEELPLFSLDDYVEHLFPESPDQTTFWRETRDLLVFRIYEKLHGWLVNSGFVDDADDETGQSDDESQEGN